MCCLNSFGILLYISFLSKLPTTLSIISLVLILGNLPNIKLNKFIAAIQNWKKINSGKSKILREYDGECFGDALEIILDLSISDGEGCGEEAGPGENWFGGEFTWADICEAGQNNEDLIDSNGQVWEMEFLFAILTEFQDGSNLCYLHNPNYVKNNSESTQCNGTSKYTNQQCKRKTKHSSGFCQSHRK